ncbi:MAG: DUF2780 domain-containing protein [Dehalococcoidia bacterium]|nr:DUF2780 domain-containing protein [Dehalococcoidia bacterium]
MELVDQLVKGLGINEGVAQGGAGLIFKMAKDKLGAGDFSQVANVVPGINDLMKSAPESGGLLGGIGELASSFGGGASQLGNLASLAGGFSKLGLDAGMIGKFLPIILSFVQSKGGDTVSAILEKVLK